MNWTPKSNLAEWSITYRCNLACKHCCRFGYLPPTTQDMTLCDAAEFVKQAKAMSWQPAIWITGGEPTLHPSFVDFVALAFTFSNRVRVFSNAFSPESRTTLAAVESRWPGCVFTETHKTAGSVAHSRKDHCLAPIDFGVDLRTPCHCHSAFRSGCGISVDSEGYTVCPNGGAIDGILKVGLRTRQLTDLFRQEFAFNQTMALCSRCGCSWGNERELPSGTLGELYGVRMSKTWMTSIRGLKD